MKKITAVLLVLALVAMVMPIGARAADGASDWASQEIDQAIELNIVPYELQDNYTEDITRAEFAKIAITFSANSLDFTDIGKFVDRYITYYNETNPDKNLSYSDNFFTDTDDFYVNCAKAIGIVNGREDGTFDPDGKITRQEAAVMLLNTYYTYAERAKHNNQGAVALQKMADRDKMATWAYDSILYMWEWGVMTGVSDTEYDPLGRYTREQAIATFLRLYSHGPINKANDNISNPFLP